MVPDTTPPASWRVWAVRLVCLALILSAHFATRWMIGRAALNKPAIWGTSSLYPDVYRVSLALAEGKGYRTIALGGVPLTEQSNWFGTKPSTKRGPALWHSLHSFVAFTCQVRSRSSSLDGGSATFKGRFAPIESTN